MRKNPVTRKAAELNALEVVKRLQIVRPRDLDALGIPRESLRPLLKQGALVRVGRGIYTASGIEVSGHRSLAEVAKVVPNGIVCLLSALRYHGLTTQAPPEVWLAIDVHGWRPRNTPFPVRVVYSSGPALTEGIETHQVDGVPVRIYSAAKTVADCFKYRNKIGPEVAIEAMKDYLQRHRRGADELWRFAKICRVSNVMRPYLESAG
jgi:predicted transcriptional regulator of viral defense system